MTDLWKNTCVLISATGEVILSNPMVRGHNEAINDCAGKIGLDIPTEQSMISMLEIINKNNHVVLLNAGMVKDDEGIERRTGYLSLPSHFVLEQLEQIETLKMLLEEYKAITVWKIINDRLDNKSIGNKDHAILIIQEMIDELSKENIKSSQK